MKSWTRSITALVIALVATAALAAPPRNMHPTVRVGAVANATYTAPVEVAYSKPNGDSAKAKVGHRHCFSYVNPGTAPGAVAATWTECYDNLVPDVALNKILDDTYKTGTKDASFYCGLITGPGAAGVAAGDTMASHAGWTESTAYSDATRPAWTPGTVASKSVSNSASPCVFNVNASATIGGAFLVGGPAGSANTKSGTAGTLRSAGAFSSGDKSVSNGGTLTVTITATAQ
jgi:hypothetical protein